MIGDTSRITFYELRFTNYVLRITEGTVMAKLLTVQNVSKIFGSEGLRKKDVTVAVDQVTFSLADDRPTITAIAGESGSGKSITSLAGMA